MAVWSCLNYKTVTSSCVDYVHPWNDSCIDSWLGLLLHSLKYSLRTYTTLYLFTTLMRRKKPSIELIKQTVLAILQSTAFLTTHAYGFAVCACTLRRLTGSFNVLSAAFTPAFLSSLVAIHIERQSRRPILCLYVTNVASETLFRMAVDRGWVKPIRNGQVAIFALAMASLLYRFRGNHPKESMFDLIKFVIGANEKIPCPVPSSPDSPEPPTAKCDPSSTRSVSRQSCDSLGIIGRAIRVYSQLLQKIKSGSKAACCPHSHSCLFYSLQGGVRMLAVGYGVQVILRTVLSLRKAYRNPKLLATNFVSNKVINLGAFLGLFVATFRGASCLLRNVRGKDDQSHAVPAGLLASLAFFFYPDNTAALYVMWKALQMTFMELTDSGYLPQIPYSQIILYSFSTAVLFHGNFLEPQNLRPAYVKFLDGLSGGRSTAMDRVPLDGLGLDTSRHLNEVCQRLNINQHPRYSLRIFGNLYPKGT